MRCRGEGPLWSSLIIHFSHIYPGVFIRRQVVSSVGLMRTYHPSKINSIQLFEINHNEIISDSLCRFTQGCFNRKLERDGLALREQSRGRRETGEIHQQRKSITGYSDRSKVRTGGVWKGRNQMTSDAGPPGFYSRLGLDDSLRLALDKFLCYVHKRMCIGTRV